MRNRIIFAVSLLSLLLAAIDSTAVGTLLPTIEREFGASPLNSWLISGFILAQTVATPAFGRFSDIYGLKKSFSVAISLFLIGSVYVATGSGKITLIAGRVIQGLGAGGIPVLCYTAIAILSSPEDRARKQSTVSSVWGVAAILGPILGASFAQNFGWRWLFWVNMPLGIIALGAVIIWFPSKSSQNTRPFNWVALTLFSLFMTSLLVLLTIPTLPLPKDLIVGITILFLCSFVGLFYSLKNKVKVAFFEFELLKNPIFRFSALANFASGIVLYGSIANLPQYVEFTLLKSVNQAGFTVMFGALGWVLGAVVVGKTVHKFGFRKEAITGGLLLTMGSALLTSRPESLIICALSQGLLGFGMGVLASSTLVLSQNTASRINIGAATSGIQFSRSLGASIGVNIFALIFSAVEQRSETSLHGEGFSAGFLFLTISASIATIFCIGLPRSNTLEFDSRADQLLENS